MDVVGVILAAGLGTRLRPSTKLVPKPLIPVGGVEPLYFALHRAFSVGLRKFVVNAHYLPEQVQRACQEWAPHFPGAEIRVSVESPQILGTGGALLKIIQENKDWFKSSALLLQNGDTLAQIPLQNFLRDAQDCQLAVSYFPEHLRKYNPLWLDATGHWSGIGKLAPESTDRAAHFLGVHVLSATATWALAEAKNFPIENIDLFNGIYRPLTNLGFKFRAQTFEFSGNDNFWFDMTTQEFLLEAQHHVLSTLEKSSVWRTLLQHRYPSIRELSPGVWATHTKQGISFQAPAVWVEGANPRSTCEIPRLTVGPHAAFICERGQVSQPSLATEKKIANSVIFISGDKQAQLVEDLTNQLYVV